MNVAKKLVLSLVAAATLALVSAPTAEAGNKGGYGGYMPGGCYPQQGGGFPGGGFPGYPPRYPQYPGNCGPTGCYPPRYPQQYPQYPQGSWGQPNSNYGQGGWNQGNSGWGGYGGRR